MVTCGFDLISLTISDGEHLLICLLTIDMSSLEKCLFNFSVHLLLSCMSIFVDMTVKPFQVYDVQIYSPI